MLVLSYGSPAPRFNCFMSVGVFLHVEFVYHMCAMPGEAKRIKSSGTGLAVSHHVSVNHHVGVSHHVDARD